MAATLGLTMGVGSLAARAPWCTKGGKRQMRRRAAARPMIPETTSDGGVHPGLWDLPAVNAASCSEMAANKCCSCCVDGCCEVA
jgi:hypothetical protein